MLNTIRWFLVPLSAFLTGCLATGIVHWTGQWLLGRWAITSGLVLFYTTGAFIVGWTGGGLFIAPKKSLNVQRAIASPLVFPGIFWVYNTLAVTFWDALPDHELLLSASVPPAWEYAIHSSAFIVTLYNVFT